MMDPSITIKFNVLQVNSNILVLATTNPLLAHNTYKGNNQQTVLKCCNLVSFINATNGLLVHPCLFHLQEQKHFNPAYRAVFENYLTQIG